MDEEPEFVQGRRARQPQGVRRQVVRRAGQGDLLEELLDVAPRVVPLEHRASWDALEWALEEQP